METITITREWHKPQITVSVTNTEISLNISLADYLLALSEELGSPAMVMRKATLLVKMQEASEKVIAKVKLESAKAV
jgi:hypothetical protein